MNYGWNAVTEGKMVGLVHGGLGEKGDYKVASLNLGTFFAWRLFYSRLFSWRLF